MVAYKKKKHKIKTMFQKKIHNKNLNIKIALQNSDVQITIRNENYFCHPNDFLAHPTKLPKNLQKKLFVVKKNLNFNVGWFS
jgi:hypothetical protein